MPHAASGLYFWRRPEVDGGSFAVTYQGHGRDLSRPRPIPGAPTHRIPSPWAYLWRGWKIHGKFQSLKVPNLSSKIWKMSLLPGTTSICFLCFGPTARVCPGLQDFPWRSPPRALWTRQTAALRCYAATVRRRNHRHQWERSLSSSTSNCTRISLPNLGTKETPPK